MSKPLESYSYTLTKADALAIELMPRGLDSWRVYVIAIFFLGAISIMASLPESWVGQRFSLQFMVTAAAVAGIAFALVASAVTQLRYARAARRLPAPQPVTLEVWPDQLVTLADGAERSVRFEEIAKVLTTPSHVVLALVDGPVIVPRLAFATDAAMAGFAARMEQAGRAATATAPLTGRRQAA